MSDTQNFAFGQFVPGFDFLQNLAKGASQAMPQMPNLSSWVAPTLNVEDLEKRIGELRAVHFWLEQNSRALSATIQALEVQKMTLATLKGMNFSLADLASAMQVKPMEAGAPAPAPAAAPTPAAAPAKPTESAAAASASAGKEQGDKAAAAPAPASAPAAGLVDPLQWWSSLTQQFQNIASSALQEAAQRPGGGDVVRSMADAAGQAMKTAARMTEAATGVPAAAPAPARQATARKSPARKATPRKTPAQGAAPAKTARKTTGRSRT